MAEKMIFCKACRKEIAKSAKTCPHCGKSNKRPFWVTLLIIVGVLIVLSIIGNLLPDTDSLNRSQTKASSISKEEYITSCQKYAYDEIARNPNDYKGKPGVFSGKIIQVMESGKNITFRVNVTKGKYDIWSDTMYVDYNRQSENESRVLEDDIVKFYGNINGIKTYKTVLGGTISIPWVIAYYIEPIK